MSLRRAGILALPLLVVACTDVTQVPLPPDLVFAALASPNIPAPSDLALASTVVRAPIPDAAGCATPVDLCAEPLPPGFAALKSTQVELLCALRAAGGFPADQESTITIPLTAVHWDPADGDHGNYIPVAAPAVDPATVTADTVAVYRVDGTVTRVDVELDVDATKTYAGSCTGSGVDTVCKPAQITLRKKADPITGSRRWAAGARYAFAIRGGASGVKTTTGLPISASPAIALALPNRDLSKKENQPLGAIDDSTKPGQCGAGTNQDEITLLNTVRAALWNPLRWSNTAAGWAPAPDPTVTPAFAAIDGAFPRGEAATVAAFGVAALPTTLITDSGSGAMPFPSDFLLASNGKVRELGSFCGGKFDPGTTSCATARALTTLDGFSTTGTITISASGNLKQGSPPANSVFVFDLTAPTVPVDLGGGTIVNLPPRLQDVTVAGPAAHFATQAQGATLGIQPAVSVALSPTVTAFLPPLQPKHRYAVVITDKLLDAADQPVAPSTLGKLLWKFTGAIATAGKSNVSSILDADAVGLQALRDGLTPLLAGALPAYSAGAVGRANVLMAYTLTTQDVTSTSLGVTAAPYAALAAIAPTVATELTPAQWETATTFPAAALPTVSKVVTGKYTSLEAFDPSTGALNPTSTAWTPAQRDYLATLPAVDPVACNATTPCARPLVIFHHGFTGSRLQMLGIAGALAQRGFIAAAADAPFHGARAFCDEDADCNTGPCTPATFTFTPPGATQPVTVPNQAAPATCGGDGSLKPTDDLSTVASGKYFVSANFFRTRDAIRHDLLDQSALILALAPPAPRGTDPFAAALVANGVAVDATRIYYVGQSLGGIIGTSLVATNPRIATAVLNVPGGPVVDVFTTSPSFTTPASPGGTSRLEDALAPVLDGFTVAKVTPGNAAFDPVMFARYRQLLLVAKWILDPADPINYAASVGTKLTGPLAAAPPGGLGGTPFYHPTSTVFGQLAQGDLVVPTPTGRLLLGLVPTTPTLYQSAAGTGDLAHGFLLSGGPFNVMQTDAATFLFDGTTPVGDVTVP